MADNTTNNKIVTTVELDVNLAAQEIVKLNSLASDSTAGLSERLDAKNKQIKIQNDLNKKGISDLEKQVKGLRGVVGKEKEYIKATQKLEKAKLNEVKVTERNAKSQRKLTDSYGKSKGAINKLDNATGGMITRLKALAANPIILFMTLLVGAFTLLKKAFTSSEEGQNKWNKAMAVVDALLGNLLDLVADFANILVDLFSNPKESLESFGKLIKENLINRFDGLINLIPELGKAITLLFSGKFSEAGKVAGNAVAKVALGVDDLSGKIIKATEATKNFIKEQEREANLAAQVADKRAEADKIERQLLVDRSVLEAKIAQKRLDAKKENEFTSKQRKAFLEEAQKLEDQLIEKETKYLELRRDAQILENTFSRSNKENLDAEAKAIAAVNDQQAVRAKKAKKLQTELNTITKEIERDDKKDSKELNDFKQGLILKESESKTAAIERERSENILALENLKITEEEKSQLLLDIDTNYRAKKKGLDAEEDALKLEKEIIDLEVKLEKEAIEMQRLLENDRLTVDERIKIQQDYVDRVTDIKVKAAAGDASKEEKAKKDGEVAKGKIRKIELKAESEKNKAILESGINMAADAFGIAQEVAVAKMLMAAPEAIGNVWSQAAKQPTIPQMLLHGAVGTATTISPIVKGLKDIKKTRFSKKKGGTGGGGGSISSASAGSAPVGVSDISSLAESNASRLGTNSSLSSRASADAVNGGTLGGVSGNIIFSENAHNNFRSQVNFREDRTTMGG